MSGFLTRLAARALGRAPTVWPVVGQVFEDAGISDLAPLDEGVDLAARAAEADRQAWTLAAEPLAGDAPARSSAVRALRAGAATEASPDDPLPVRRVAGLTGIRPVAGRDVEAEQPAARPPAVPAGRRVAPAQAAHPSSSAAPTVSPPHRAAAQAGPAPDAGIRQDPNDTAGDGEPDSSPPIPGGPGPGGTGMPGPTARAAPADVPDPSGPRPPAAEPPPGTSRRPAASPAHSEANLPETAHPPGAAGPPRASRHLPARDGPPPERPSVPASAPPTGASRRAVAPQPSAPPTGASRRAVAPQPSATPPPGAASAPRPARHQARASDPAALSHGAPPPHPAAGVGPRSQLAQDRGPAGSPAVRAGSRRRSLPPDITVSVGELRVELPAPADETLRPPAPLPPTTGAAAPPRPAIMTLAEYLRRRDGGGPR